MSLNARRVFLASSLFECGSFCDWAWKWQTAVLLAFQSIEWRAVPAAGLLIGFCLRAEYWIEWQILALTSCLISSQGTIAETFSLHCKWWRNIIDWNSYFSVISNQSDASEGRIKGVRDRLRNLCQTRQAGMNVRIPHYECHVKRREWGTTKHENLMSVLSSWANSDISKCLGVRFLHTELLTRMQAKSRPKCGTAKWSGPSSQNTVGVTRRYIYFLFISL